MRALPSAKSRLAETLPPGTHADVVAAIRADTLTAARAARPVARVLVIGDEPGPGVDLVQSTPGLNGALRDGAALANKTWPADAVAALVGDLPALRPDELTATLGAAAEIPAGYVRDAEGIGTTMLTATPGTVLDPHFGAGSAHRHAARAAELAAGPGLRHDVDTADDLARAAALGLGRRTAAVLAGRGIAPRSS